MEMHRPINRRPIRLASDEKLARWRADLEAAMRTEKPADETQASWDGARAWVWALIEAIRDEQADRGQIDVVRIKRA